MYSFYSGVDIFARLMEVILLSAEKVPTCAAPAAQKSHRRACLLLNSEIKCGIPEPSEQPEI